MKTIDFLLKIGLVILGFIVIITTGSMSPQSQVIILLVLLLQTISSRGKIKNVI